MLKKLFCRRIKHPRRRTTFLRMFLKGMILPVLITLTLGFVMSYFVRMNAISMANNQTEAAAANYLRRIIRKNNEPDTRRIPDTGILMLAGTLDYTSAGYLDPGSWIEPDANAAVFTFDENGTIVNTNRIKILYAIRNNMNSSETKWYYCDPLDWQIPELDRLFDEYIQYVCHDYCNYTFHVENMYLDEETQKMLPHVMEVTRYRYKKPFLNYYELEDDWGEEEESYQITLDYVPDGYTYTELHSASEEPDVFPQGSMFFILGCEPDFFDAAAAACREKVQTFIEKDYTEYNEYPDDTAADAVKCRIERIYGDDKEYGIVTYYELKLTGLPVWRRLIFVLGLLFTGMTLFVLTLCLIRNAKNKAQYEFEDYQRALTNNLAHDLKTPLAVIGGYAENLLQMRQDSGSEKELVYLRSIMNNVAYTDGIIQKTLQLGETEQIKKPHKIQVDTVQFVKGLTEKYSTALAERDISLTVEGSGTVIADEDLLTASIENLLSNAVKYTPDGGKIRIEAGQKQLSVVNDTAEDVDVKLLTMPFVKGDKTRSDKRSSGLGLAIAKAAAEQNGFMLKLICKDKQFTAVIRF